MALRMATYVHLLYQQLEKENRLAPQWQLPPVFPVVLYNGNRPWIVPKDIKSRISLPSNSPLWQWQPNLRYCFIDESQYPEGKPGSLTGFVFRLRLAQTPRDFRAALDELAHVLPGYLDSVKRAFSVWITHVVAPYKGIDLQPRDMEKFDEVKEMLSTRIEEWEDKI